MRTFPLPAAAILALLAGCVYLAPLAEKHTIPLDGALLGLWDVLPEPGQEKKKKDGGRMLVLRFSRTEYMIHYPVGQEGFYFRGYPIRIGDIPCLQLQLLGTDDKGPVKGKIRERYMVFSYTLEKEGVTVKSLNTELVPKNLKSSEQLQKAFLLHRKNPALFHKPFRLHRRR